jgi:hypothetical protein
MLNSQDTKLQRTAAWTSNTPRDSGDFATLHSPKVYKLSWLRMQPRVKCHSPWALETASVFRRFLHIRPVPYYGKWMKSFLASQFFWETTCSLSFLLHIPLSLCFVARSQNRSLHRTVETHLQRHRQAEVHVRTSTVGGRAANDKRSCTRSPARA